jgi:hypothetical protein
MRRRLRLERRQIGLREVPVVVRFFLAAHRRRLAEVAVPQPRLLMDDAASPEHLDLPLDLELERLLEIPERVDVLDLRLRAEGRLPDGPDRHVRIAAQTALFHVAVVGAQGDEDLAQPREALRRIGGRPQVGIGDDLDEGHAAAIEVERRAAIGVREAVQRLARVLFHVHACDADRRRARAARELDMPAECERPFVLRDLIALRQVGIEVVLPREDRLRLNAAPERQRRTNRQLHGAAVEHRQRARQPETDRTDMGVRRRAERRAAPAEDLGVGQQLCVDLEANHRLVAHIRLIVSGNRAGRKQPPLAGASAPTAR